MIQLATPTHAAPMAAIHAAAFPASSWDAASFATLLAQPGVHGWIDDGGGVLGGGILLLRTVADEAEVLTIGATPPRQGIGRALLDHALAFAAARDVVAVFLEVDAANSAARGLYAAAGFIAAGLRPNYYPNGADAVLLKLTL